MERNNLLRLPGVPKIGKAHEKYSPAFWRVVDTNCRSMGIRYPTDYSQTLTNAAATIGPKMMGKGRFFHIIGNTRTTVDHINYR